MSDEKFKMPQSSYEELTKVIKAYGHFSEPTGLDDVSKFIGLHTTIISRNAGFLIGVGILEPGAKKVPTLDGKKLAHALEHNMPDEIRTWWRRIVSGNDFLTRLLAAIRIRSGMDQQTLEAHIAYSAGQPKKAQFMTGARTIIDILRAAELIKEAEGKFIAEQPQITVTESSFADTLLSTPRTGPVLQPTPLPISSSDRPKVQSALVMSIQVNINCTAADVPVLGQQIKKLMEELQASGPGTKADEGQG
jgi:hypothetical protein